jgi:hypothetical protein
MKCLKKLHSMKCKEKHKEKTCSNILFEISGKDSLRIETRINEGCRLLN